MSSISLVLAEGQPYVGIRPDPNAPPQLLASVIRNFRLPTNVPVATSEGTQTVSLSGERLLRLLSETTELPEPNALDAEKPPRHAGQRFDSDALVRAFATLLGNLVTTLNQSVETVTALMGEVDHVVLVFPPVFSVRARRRLARLDAVPGVRKISTVPYHAAVMLYHGKGTIPTTPFIDLHWESTLRIGRRSFPEGDLADMATLGRDSVLHDVSLELWHKLTARWLGDRFRDLAGDPTPWSKAQTAEFGPWADATAPKLCMAALRGDSSFPLAFGSRHCDLSATVVTELQKLLLVAPANFSRVALKDRGIERDDMVFVSHGTTLRWPAVRECLRHVLARLGRSDASVYPDAHAALGALLARGIAPPCVPYDCGVLIRPTGQKEGIGTLVLVRGASADTEAISRPFYLPKNQSEDVEVLFYTRCVNFDTSEITYRFAEKNIRFAPAHDKAGKTDFHATMTLSTDKDGRVDAVRTVMHDKISGKSYEFPALPFTGGSCQVATISRGKKHAEVEQWCEKIDAVGQPDAAWTVQDWREALDRHVTITRDRYLQIVLGLQAMLSDHSRFTQLMNAAPEKVQEQMRVHLHGQMVRLANLIGGRHVGEWCRKYARPAKVEALARDFKNSVYQDAVDNVPYQNQAGELARNYEFACSDPYSLNVEWDDRDLSL